MESYNNGTQRVSRGGFYTSYGYSYPASHRNNTTINQGVNNVGLRQSLYVLNIPYQIDITTPTREDVKITLNSKPHIRI